MKKQDRVAFAVFLIFSLTAAEVSAGGEDGPMARAPLPPPLSAAPQQISSAQGGSQSQTPSTSRGPIEARNAVCRPQICTNGPVVLVISTVRVSPHAARRSTLGPPSAMSSARRRIAIGRLRAP